MESTLSQQDPDPKDPAKLEAERLAGIEKVRDLIITNPAVKKSLAERVKSARVNEYYLKKKFKEVYGTNMHAMLMQERIVMAKKLLIESDKTIADIGSECGYNNPDYFRIFFKREVGMTPSAFRKSTALK